MKVSDLIAQLEQMPQELEVMLPCEAGLDHVMRIGIVLAAKTKFDGSEHRSAIRGVKSNGTENRFKPWGYKKPQVQLEKP